MVLIPTPDPDDPLKVRRALTFLALFQFIIFVPMIVYAVVVYSLPESVALGLIGLEGAVVGGPAWAYLWAAKKADK